MMPEKSVSFSLTFILKEVFHFFKEKLPKGSSSPQACLESV